MKVGTEIRRNAILEAAARSGCADARGISM